MHDKNVTHAKMGDKNVTHIQMDDEYLTRFYFHKNNVRLQACDIFVTHLSMPVIFVMHLCVHDKMPCIYACMTRHTL